MLLHQSLNNAGREQHGIDIIFQRRAVMTVSVEAVDGIVDVKSVKRHAITMPRTPGSGFDLDQIAGSGADGTVGRTRHSERSIRCRFHR